MGAHRGLEGWPHEARARIEAVIARAQPGAVAVLDWDNTSARGDVGDLAWSVMLDEEAVRWPEGGAATWGALSPAAHRAIVEVCGNVVPGRALLTRASAAGELLAEIVLGGTARGAPAFAHAVGPHYRASYGMMVRMFAGLRVDEVQGLAERTVARGLAQPVGARRTLGGVVIDDYLRLQEPMRALMDALGEAGIAVWIVSASFEPLVQAFAARAGIPAHRVIGARLDQEAGTYRASHPYQDALGPLIPFDEGKRFWIRHAIFGLPPERAIAPPEPGDARPVLAAGDSDTDHAMLAFATGLRILFDRGAPRVAELARSAPGSFVVLPSFVDPRPHHEVLAPRASRK